MEIKWRGKLENKIKSSIKLSGGNYDINFNSLNALQNGIE